MLSLSSFDGLTPHCCIKICQFPVGLVFSGKGSQPCVHGLIKSSPSDVLGGILSDFTGMNSFPFQIAQAFEPGAAWIGATMIKIKINSMILPFFISCEGG